MSQKWPNQIFPMVNFIFPLYGHCGQGGGGLGEAPPLVFSILKTPWKSMMSCYWGWGSIAKGLY